MNENTPRFETLDGYVSRSWASFQDACTRCGKCVQVCPVVPFASAVADEDPGRVVAGVLDYMSGAADSLANASEIWAKQCNGCQDCIPECPEHLNPHWMLTFTNAEIARRTNPTPHLFQKMARSVRILASMQLVPEDAARLLRPKKARDVDVIFYTGCNPLRTPNLLFNAMSVLDALGVNYEVMGGPASCCGIVQSKWEGDLARGGRVSEQTLHKFGEFKPERVLNWCPSCQVYLTETINDFRRVSYEIDHVSKFLLERKADLISRFNTRIDKRVVLHTHHGIPEVGGAVLDLLRAIPGLTVVDVVEEPGYMCGSTSADKAPEMKAAARAETIGRCLRDDVDLVVSLYHSCHRQLCAEGLKHGFDVMNFTELLVRALGLDPYEDTMRQFLGRTDWRAMVEEAAPALEENGIDMDHEELAAVLPEIFAMSEYKGGLCRFAPDGD